jgi:hypothetical protein
VSYVSNIFNGCANGLDINDADCVDAHIAENNFDGSTDDIQDGADVNTHWGNNLWKDGTYDNTHP